MMSPAKQAVLDSAEESESLGESPPTTVVLQSGGDAAFIPCEVHWLPAGYSQGFRDLPWLMP